VDKGIVGSIRLFKWALALQSSEKRLSKWVAALHKSKDAGWKTFAIQRILSSQLLALIEEQGVTKFLVYSGDIEVAKDALLVCHVLVLLHVSEHISSNQHANTQFSPALGFHPRPDLHHLR